MKQHIGHLSVLVNDYDEAIAFYVDKLQFEVLDDIDQGEGKRWVLIAPKGASNFSLLLAKASSEGQQLLVGNQTGGRVFLFLYTDDIERDYQNLLDKKVTIVEELTSKPHGTVLVFADLYGNLWDLIQPSK